MSQKRLLALVGGLAIFASACGGTTATPSPASQEPGASTPASASAEPSSDLAAEQILNVDIAGEPPTLDPNKAQDSNSLTVLRALHRPLVYVNDKLEVVDALAESHEISADAKTLTFHLRDAKYSNGDPIVAGDLVYSWKRLVDPRTAAPYSYVMAEVEGAGDLLDMAGQDPLPADAEITAALDKLGVEAPDDKTFIVHLSTPATYFLTAMTLWVGVPMQEKWITSEGATEAANYVSSGPFMLDTWNHNSEIVLKPNPNWYGDVKPTLTEIHMSMSPEPAQAMAAYEAGEIDMLLPVPSEDIERVKGDPVLSAEYKELTDLSVTYYNYNNGHDKTGKGTLARCNDPKACPTANKDFRIALTQAVDKEAFKNATFAGLGKVAGTFIQPGIPGSTPDYEPYPFDLEAAKAHMATALQALGYASAADIPALKFGFNSGSGHEPRVAFLANAWKEAFGLKTEQIGSEFGVFLTQRTAGEYDIARNGWGADYPHANNQLNGLFTCGGGNNDQQYCNSAFDDLIKQAAVEPDQAKQTTLYEQADKMLADDAASLFLRWGVQAELVKPYVGGLTTTPMDSQVPGEHFYETIKILNTK
ncbi:MAG TPA: peptide ABC transporter substrate-binding protein [Candidatus Limnocylindrales bacterium]|jgi:oligopeptide transport system substrate-binding protein|nr:peptide ABC transporter substrate-binding protein [Candidatus Limnocylindrales bacterium]